MVASIFGLVQSIMEYEEHEKRAWSVDFSSTEPSMLVSGSDDCKVNFFSPFKILQDRYVKLNLQYMFSS